jgi:hypothetical protein
MINLNKNKLFYYFCRFFLLILLLYMFVYHTFFYYIYLLLFCDSVSYGLNRINTHSLLSLLFYTNVPETFYYLFYSFDWYRTHQHSTTYVDYYTIYPSFEHVKDCFKQFGSFYLVYDFLIYKDINIQIDFLLHIRLLLLKLYDNELLVTNMYLDVVPYSKFHLRFWLRYSFLLEMFNFGFIIFK